MWWIVGVLHQSRMLESGIWRDTDLDNTMLMSDVMSRGSYVLGLWGVRMREGGWWVRCGAHHGIFCAWYAINWSHYSIYNIDFRLYVYRRKLSFDVVCRNGSWMMQCLTETSSANLWEQMSNFANPWLRVERLRVRNCDLIACLFSLVYHDVSLKFLSPPVGALIDERRHLQNV